MKIKTLLLSATLLAATVGGSATSYAATYPDATHGKSDAAVEFKADTDPGGPVNPTDPTDPVDPVDPTNPNGGELMITYASNLDFGIQGKLGTEFFAKADKINKDDGSGGVVEENITPFISIKDARGTDRKGWTLTAKLDDVFKDTKGNELTGAELILSNLFSGSGQNGAPVTTTGDITLSTTDAPIATADATQGVGNWAVGLGTLQGTKLDTTNGVKLSIPGTSIKNNGVYKTTVTYTLTAQP